MYETPQRNELVASFANFPHELIASFRAYHSCLQSPWHRVIGACERGAVRTMPTPLDKHRR